MGPGVIVYLYGHIVNFYNDPKFQQAAMEATRRARAAGTQQRIYRAYGQYHVRAADVDYSGEHVAFVSENAYKLPADQ